MNVIKSNLHTDISITNKGIANLPKITSFFKTFTLDLDFKILQNRI